jgi:PilZ domain
MFMFPTKTKMEVIHQDRRDDRRYPIELQLRYKVLARSRPQLLGGGRTVNISSGGVLFGGDQNLPLDAFVELSIYWPVLLQNTCPLTLLIMGRVVRCEDHTIAVKASRYEFITRPVRNAQDLSATKLHNKFIS